MCVAAHTYTHMCVAARTVGSDKMRSYEIEENLWDQIGQYVWDQNKRIYMALLRIYRALLRIRSDYGACTPAKSTTQKTRLVCTKELVLLSRPPHGKNYKLLYEVVTICTI